MGLDNYPDPEPCKALEEAGKLKIFLDAHGDIDCVKTNCPFTKQRLVKVYGCWIRGKIFDKYVWNSCNESLYKDKNREELEYILKSLKRHHQNIYLGRIENVTDDDRRKLEFLIKYIETLLSVEEWNGMEN